jgi:hypothetical protein
VSVTQASDVTRWRAVVLELSDALDAAEKHALAMWLDGYLAGIYAVKAAQHGIVLDLRQHRRAWDGMREDFGKPRPGDYPGRAA